MLENLGTLGLFVALALIFPLVLLGLPLILRYSGVIPQNPSRVKQDTYECGMMPFEAVPQGLLRWSLAHGLGALILAPPLFILLARDRKP